MIKKDSFDFGKTQSRVAYVESLMPDPRLVEIEAKAAKLIREHKSSHDEITSYKEWKEGHDAFLAHVAVREAINIDLTTGWGEMKQALQEGLEKHGVTFPDKIAEESTAQEPDIGPDFDAWYFGKPCIPISAMSLNIDDFFDATEIKELQEDLPEDGPPTVMGLHEAFKLQSPGVSVTVTDDSFYIPIGTISMGVDSNGHGIIEQFDGKEWVECVPGPTGTGGPAGPVGAHDFTGIDGPTGPLETSAPDTEASLSSFLSICLDRVNVVRTLKYVKKAISEAIDAKLFEPNDKITRDQIASQIGTVLESLQMRKGIEDYSVICDETNNSTAQIEHGELNVDVMIKHRGHPDFIHLPANAWSASYGGSVEVKSTHPDDDHAWLQVSLDLYRVYDPLSPQEDFIFPSVCPDREPDYCELNGLC